MPQYIMLTRVSVESLSQPKSLETLERHALDAIRKTCPQGSGSRTMRWPGRSIMSTSSARRIWRPR